MILNLYLFKRRILERFDNSYRFTPFPAGRWKGISTKNVQKSQNDRFSKKLKTIQKRRPG